MQTQFLQSSDLLKKLKDIEKSISSYDNLNMSLMEGMPGVILFLDRYYEITRDSSLIKSRDFYIDNLLSFIDKADTLSLTYCDGLIGALSFIRVLGYENKVSYFDFEKDTDEYLHQVMCENLLAGRFDLLHGGLGIFWYYVIRIKTSVDVHEVFRLQRYLETGLKIIEDTAIKDANGYRWKSEMKGNSFFKDEEVFNMGLAHGQPGILAIVSLSASSLVDNKRALRIIDESSKFISNIWNKDMPSQFPSHYHANIDMPYNSRLAWCYGDLGVSLALNFGAKVLNNESLKSISEKIALKSTFRKEIRDTSLFDAGICHGSSGVSHIYGIWYEITGNHIFKNAQYLWMNKTMEYSTNIDGLAGFKTHIKDEQWGKDMGLLKGIAGIGLAMISFLNKKRSWDTFLILS